jgi:hypothetical protein
MTSRVPRITPGFALGCAYLQIVDLHEHLVWVESMPDHRRSRVTHMASFLFAGSGTKCSTFLTHQAITRLLSYFQSCSTVSFLAQFSNTRYNSKAFALQIHEQGGIYS